MTPARLQTIEEIFHAALDQEPEQTSAFLDTACEGDQLLRRKVETLLASHQRAGGFIETSAVGITTRIIENGQPDVLVGQTIGHYKISKRIGTGGMGEVYLATDITAGRKAALKLLPARFTGNAERLTRFQQEARAVVGLNHPNILTVYEIGEDHSIHYIASELIEGETLRHRLMRGRMQLSEAVDVAIQVTSALAAAHEAGIVHRDIKPENIMLRPDGYVKVLDFGIAKLAESAFAEATADRAESTTLAETHLGSLLGTVRYMSPEQACGAPIDKRTDVWSLGVVLYEMVTGHAPFTGGTAGEVMASILEKEPPPLTSYVAHTPAELQQIISKTLRKDREERFHTAHELLEALKGLRHKLEFKAELRRSATARSWLRWTAMTAALLALAAIVAAIMMFSSHRVRSTPAAPEKSIAVLPFQNDRRDPDNAYFADGIQDEILTRLSKIADLKVISRTSTQHYKSAPENLPEIARQLGVAHVVEGSVQRRGDTVRVNVQLIKAANDSHLWAETFDRKLSDIFSVETEVAKTIADQLRAHVTGREEQEITAKPTDHPEAYDAYLRALAYSLKAQNSPANSLGSQKHLREAVRFDPNFALAWALLSFVDSVGYIGITLQATESLREEARQAAERALTLQPDLGEGLVAKGYYDYAYLKDYHSAVRYFEQARPLLPNSSRIPELLAFVARREGRWEQSESFFNQAEQVDPRNVSLLSQHALSYILLRRFPEALRKLDQVLNITPDDVDTLALKASIAQAEGDLPRASAILGPLHPVADNTAALETQVYQAILERRTDQMISRLNEILARPDPAMGYFNGELRFWLGWAQQVGGDHAAAQESWRHAQSELKGFLQEQPENYNLMHDLALVEMGLGNKAAALAMAERAIATNPIEKDVVDGPASIEILARVAAQAGEPDRAVAALQKLLSIPYEGALPVGNAPLTVALLRLDPMFDPLRNDPRFQKLCEEKQP
jgi:serine/threonine protein kinase/Tfp pilus assembly protein PilF